MYNNTCDLAKLNCRSFYYLFQNFKYYTPRNKTKKRYFLPELCKQNALYKVLNLLDYKQLESHSHLSLLLYYYCYRYIVQCAAEHDGIIVSNDNYRDLHAENPNWRQTIDKRLLMWTWCGDMIMFPMDPCGRYGPTLEQFLRF